MDAGAPELPTEAPVAPAEERPTLAALFSRLVEQGEIFVRAEVQVYRAQATRKALSAGLIAALIGGGLVLAQGVIVALLIGILFAIVPSVGMIWATVIVTLGGLAVAGGLIALGVSRISKLLEPDDES